MKKLALLALAVSFALADFALTPQTYGAYEDFDLICKNTFGQKATIADWQEVKKAYEEAKDKKAFVESLGLNDYDASAIITQQGKSFFENGDRHYILTYHNHTLPTNYTYLVHDTIDGHLFDLGSWREIDYPVLCSIK